MYIHKVILEHQKHGFEDLKKGYTDRASILIVDDSKSVRLSLSGMLEQNGYKIYEAGDEKEAVQIMRQEKIELVLLDVDLPGKSGLELIPDIFSFDSDTAIIMISGISKIDIVMRALKKGAFDFLIKPFADEVLETSIERALKMRKMKIENRNYHFSMEKQVYQRTKKFELALVEIQETYESTIRALGAALDLRDSETENHSLRVEQYSLKLAQSIGVKNEEMIRDLKWGAYLHDIGKIGISDTILLKPGKLTVEEIKIIQTHSEKGYNVLQKIPFLSGASELVLHHHEAWNGTGYPKGLKGKDIPLSARLFAVADTIDAMKSDRPYRKALNYEQIKDELAKCAGVQFDPSIVKVFEQIPESEWNME